MSECDTCFGILEEDEELIETVYGEKVCIECFDEWYFSCPFCDRVFMYPIYDTDNVDDIETAVYGTLLCCKECLEKPILKITTAINKLLRRWKRFWKLDVVWCNGCGKQAIIRDYKFLHNFFYCKECNEKIEKRMANW